MLRSLPQDQAQQSADSLIVLPDEDLTLVDVPQPVLFYLSLDGIKPIQRRGFLDREDRAWLAAQDRS